MNLTAREGSPDLVVWPETALPWLLDQSAEVLMTASMQARGVPVVMGIQRREEGRYYNSMVLVDQNGQVTEQYDKYVQGNTVAAAPSDAAIIRIDEASFLGVAVATDCNGRFCKLDPYQGTQLALAEAFRNVAVTGAKPLATLFTRG
jgi:phosphoribosylformylglycinamidine (FGAM) synthase-like enzyme